MGTVRDPSGWPPSGTMPRLARVLVIDDDYLVADSLRRVLQDDCEVTVATHVATALARLTSGDWYDVILCDVMMPGMNGVALHDYVRRSQPNLAPRFVFITGGIVLPHVQALLQDLNNLVLAKPLDLSALRELIRRRTRRDVPETGTR